MSAVVVWIFQQLDFSVQNQKMSDIAVLLTNIASLIYKFSEHVFTLLRKHAN